jgi:hypothetical protein
LEFQKAGTAVATIAAPQTIDKLVKPPGMYCSTWRHLKSVLRALTKYLPDPFPSTRELAARVHLDHATVARLLIRAEELGYITRTPRVTAAGQQSFAYALVGVAEGVANATEKTRSSPTEKNSSSYGPPALPNPPTRKVNRWAGKCAVCPFLVQPREGWLHGKLPVHRECDQGRSEMKYEREHQGDLNPSGVIGDDPTAALGTTVVADRPAVILARQFDTLWYSEIVAQYPLWKSRRPAHRGAATSYIETMFLMRGFTAEHVEALFMAFFDELADPNSTLSLRDGQTPWQLFTGWWGHVDVPDPAIDRARREENQRIADLFESRIAAEQPIRAAARARIEALPEGEIGDPEDYRLAGWPLPWNRKLG